MFKTLLSTVSSRITSFHQERLLMIQNEDYSGVIRKVKENRAERFLSTSDEYLAEGLLALQQYYAVALLDPINEHAVSDEIDPFWHAHILHTRQYSKFCEQVYGQFIHHEPLDHDDTQALNHVERLYRYTSNIYREMFNYVNPYFFPSDIPTTRLICTHYSVETSEVRSQALFPRVNLMRQLT